MRPLSCPVLPPSAFLDRPAQRTRRARRPLGLRLLPRLSALLVAALVCTLTLTCVRRAWAAVTVPNHLEFSYDLAAGGVQVFNLPISNSPVLLSASTSSPEAGTGFAQIVHNTSTAEIAWVATNYNGGTGGDKASVAAPGTHILNPGSGVFIQIHSVSATARQLKVYNSYTSQRAAGVVQEIW